MWFTPSGTLIQPVGTAHLRCYAANGKRTDGVRLGIMVAHLRAEVRGTHVSKPTCINSGPDIGG